MDGGGRIDWSAGLGPRRFAIVEVFSSTVIPAGTQVRKEAGMPSLPVGRPGLGLVLRSFDRLRAKVPPPHADDRARRVGGLRQRVDWLAPTVAAFAALAAAAGAAFRDRPTVVGAVAMGGAVALLFLLFRGFAAQVLESLDDASAGQDRLETELAAAQEAKEEYRTLAYHDGLTGLPNRTLFHDRLGLAITHSSRLQGHLALLYLDIDDFKGVNDSFGHESGDRVLVELASRIRAAVRAEDTVARVGGDEFVVLLAQVTGGGDAARVAVKVLDAVRHPFRVDGHDVTIAASVGVSVYPDDGTCCDDLVRHADGAMYRDKQRPATADPGAAAAEEDARGAD
jgi:diguanylate cyclase (GGDEF)-like protein